MKRRTVNPFDAYLALDDLLGCDAATLRFYEREAMESLAFLTARRRRPLSSRNARSNARACPRSSIASSARVCSRAERSRDEARSSHVLGSRRSVRVHRVCRALVLRSPVQPEPAMNRIKNNKRRRASLLGRNIKRARIALDWSRDRLYAESRVPTRTIEKIETGATGDMTDANLARIASALRKTTEALRGAKVS